MLTKSGMLFEWLYLNRAVSNRELLLNGVLYMGVFELGMTHKVPYSDGRL